MGNIDAQSPPLPAPFNARLAGRLPATDGRSAEAQFCRRMRAALVRHIGNRPSITQSALIDLAVDTALEIERMKCRRGEGGSLSIHDHKAFLAYVNAFRRHLVALGLKGPAERPQTLGELFAGQSSPKAVPPALGRAKAVTEPAAA
jgi:hypothetical protein